MEREACYLAEDSVTHKSRYLWGDDCSCSVPGSSHLLVHLVLPKLHSIGVVRVSKVEYLILSHIIADQNSVPGNLFPYPVLIYPEPLFLPTKAARDNSRDSWWWGDRKGLLTARFL